MTTPSQVPDYVLTQSTTPTGVHTEPPRSFQWESLSENQIQQLRKQLLEGILAAVTQALTGAFLPGPFGSAFEQLQDWATDVPVIGQVVSIAEGFVDSLIDSLLNGGAPVNVLNLFGQLPSALFGIIPANAIGSQAPNQLNNAGFDGSISMVGDGVWFYDGTVGRTSPGSARTTANGTAKALLSNAVDLKPGEQVNLGMWARSVGYVGTGTPIKMTVRTYLRNTTTGVDTVVGTSTIAQIAGPGSTFTQLTGTYTAPTNGTINRIRLRPLVDTTATAGSIWIDDASITRQGEGPFDGLLQLFGLSALDDLFGGVNVTGIWTAIINAVLNPLGLFEDHGTRNTLFGGIPVLGQILPSTVGGVTPGANLLTDVGDFLTNMFKGVTRQAATAASQADTAAAVAAQADTVVGTASSLAQIAAALGQGVPDADDFERASLGSDWGVYTTGPGGLSIPNGHDLSWSGTGSSSEYVARHLINPAATNHQTVSMVLAKAMPSYPFFTPFPYGGYNDLWLRCTAFTSFAARTGLMLRIYCAAPYVATWYFIWMNAGTPTALANANFPIPSAGSTIDFEVGVGGNMNAYQARVNGSPIGNFTDSTSRGLGNVYRGLGGKGGSGVGYAVGTADLKIWTAQG